MTASALVRPLSNDYFYRRIVLFIKKSTVKK